MTSFVTAITGADGLTAANFWTTISEAAPLIITTVLVSLGYYVVKKVVKKFSRGKAGM